MDITEFIHMYGKHNITLLNSDKVYTVLKPGDIVLEGDMAFTWISADCNELGWLKVPNVWYNKEYTADMVQVRRRHKKSVSNVILL